MTCPDCGHRNPAPARFCNGCGEPLPVACPSCDATNPPGSGFCNQCGAPLDAGQRAPPGAPSGPVPQARDPRSYTPQHLADKILQSRSALQGERKQVTVLFADVKGSMELAEELDPEEWHRILDRFFQILADGVHRFEGTVNQYTGDGIMALFGAPIAHEDHAQRACWAALRLGDELHRYADELRRTRGLSFSARMGLHSGEVVVGKIGDDLRMDYTAQGQVVGLAARVEEIAAPDRVYLTEHTAGLVTGFFQLRDLGPFGLKGVREPVRLYELHGIGRLRTRLDLSRARGFSRFVGRIEEMQALETALGRAEKGSPQVIGIVGEAGVGKSRLCFELLERCRARGIMTHETHGVAHGKSIPLLPMLSLFRASFGITGQESDATAREKIGGRLLLLDEGFREVLPLVFDSLGVADPDASPPRVDPEARQQQFLAVVRQVVQARARRETTVTLLEDLHWFDGGSEAFLEPLLDSPPGSRRLVVVNFRPEYHADWMQKSYYQQVPLLPLGAEATTELLEDLLGRDPSLAGLGELLRERTGGNPFFVEEMVQSLVESGHLDGTRGAYRLARPMDRVAVPETVQAVLAARIDRLAEREKQVLQTAAVVGKTFTEPILEEAAELPKAELSEALHLLKSAEFIYEEALYPVAEYTFKHPLTREVAYCSQLGERRQRVHGAVADAIEAVHRDQIEEHAALLAHHREAAGEALAAARWAGRAAERVGQAHPGEALRLWLKVRSLLREVPRRPEAAALGAKACSQVLSHGVTEGLPQEQAADVFGEGKELARLAGDSAQHAFLVYRYGVFRGFAGGAIQEWIDLGVEALALAEEAGDTAVAFYVQMGLAMGLVYAGRLRDAFRLCNDALARTDDPHFGSHLTGRSPYIFLLVQRARALQQMGQLRESEADLERAVHLAREHGYLFSLGLALSERVERAVLVGELGTALRDAEELLRLAEKIGSHTTRHLSHVALATAHSLSANPAEAARPLEELADALCEESRFSPVLEATGLASLSRQCFAADEPREARAIAERAARAGRQIGARVAECLSQITLAEALRRSEGTAAAAPIRNALARARELLEESEAHAYEPLILEAEGRLAELEGEQAGFESKLREAHRLFTEMGATGHAERLARELGL